MNQKESHHVTEKLPGGFNREEHHEFEEKHHAKPAAPAPVYPYQDQHQQQDTTPHPDPYLRSDIKVIPDKPHLTLKNQDDGQIKVLNDHPGVRRLDDKHVVVDDSHDSILDKAARTIGLKH